MSTTAGVFSETLLQNIRYRADQLMMDNVIKQQYTPFAIALRGLMDNQIARITPLGVKEKDYTVEIWWPNACGLEVVDGRTCPSDCTEVSTNTTTFALDYEKHVCFASSEGDFWNNEMGFAESIAVGILRAQKLLIEDFTAYAIGLLNTFTGPNALTNGVGTPVGNNTYVPAANWNSNLLAYLYRVAQYNHINSPFGLSGANLYQAWLVAKANTNATDQNLFSTLPMIFDEINVDTVNSPDLITYLIDRGSYAIANKAYFSPTPQTINGAMVRQSMTNALFPGLEFDVIYIYECHEGFANVNVEVVLKAGMFQNPSGCDDNTGILSFICGEVPA